MLHALEQEDNLNFLFKIMNTNNKITYINTGKIVNKKICNEIKRNHIELKNYDNYQLQMHLLLQAH